MILSYLEFGGDLCHNYLQWRWFSMRKPLLLIVALILAASAISVLAQPREHPTSPGPLVAINITCLYDGRTTPAWVTLSQTDASGIPITGTDVTKLAKEGRISFNVRPGLNWKVVAKKAVYRSDGTYAPVNSIRAQLVAAELNANLNASINLALMLQKKIERIAPPLPH
jgi:hypothetical protein